MRILHADRITRLPVGRREEGEAHSNGKMEQQEERLAHEVRRCQHLHNVTDRDYRSQEEATAHSWREIGRTLEEDPDRCREKWKQLRDEFVRLKKRMKTKTRDPGPLAHSIMLSWLEEFVKHWETQANVNGAATEPEDVTPDPLEKDSLDSSLHMEDISFTSHHASRHSGVFSMHSSDDDDDDESSTSVLTASPIKAPVPQSRKRRKMMGKDEILDALVTLRWEQLQTAVMSLLNPDNSRRNDEYITFALAVADSLRKLPPERVEATKSQLFVVLADAHSQVTKPGRPGDADPREPGSFSSDRGMTARPLSQGLLTFEDVAVRFTDEEWLLLDAGQQDLYQEVMAENSGMVASLIQELQPEINAEDQEAGAADKPEQKAQDGEGKSRPFFQRPTESELKTSHNVGQSPAAGPKQDCRYSLKTMAFSPPSLDFRESQKCWEARADEEDVPQSPGFTDLVNVNRELGPEEESLNGETQGRLEEKVRRPLADINSSTPVQESSGRVKILHWMETTQEGDFLGKAYQGPGSGSGNSTLESKDGFRLERPKEINPHGKLLERALGKLIQGPNAQESLEIKQDMGSLPEIKSDLALFCDEASTNGPAKTLQGRETSFDLSGNFPPRADRSENQNAPMESERIYKCSYCGKCFEESLDLVTHERAHIGEKIYRCSQCEKRFSHRIDLLTHKRNHQGEKPHQCERDCAKCNRQRTCPRASHRTRPGEQACQCSVCGERFSWKSNLIRHRRIHTGEKPYRCAECGKSYTRKTALDRHKRIHVGEKTCEIGAPNMGQASVLVLLV